MKQLINIWNNLIEKAFSITKNVFNNFERIIGRQELSTTGQRRVYDNVLIEIYTPNILLKLYL